MDSSVVEDEPACSELPTDVVIRCISRGERHDLGDSASWSIGASSLGFAGPEGSAFFFITEAYSTHRSVIDLDRRDISKIFIRSGALLTLAGLQVLYFVRLHAKTWLLKPDASKRLPPLFLFYLENYSSRKKPALDEEGDTVVDVRGIAFDGDWTSVTFSRNIAGNDDADYSLVEDINASQDTPIIFAWRSGPGIIQHPNSQRGPAWENVVSGPIAVARDEPENDFTLLSMLFLLVWMAITHYARARALEANGKNLSLFHRVSNSIPAGRKPPMCVPLACSGLLLFVLVAGGASAINCSASVNPVPPSVVEDTAGALHLAEVMNCVNGSFDVEWAGFVTLGTPIAIYSNTSLHVTGAADGSSWIDGADQFSFFEVEGGTLSLTDLTLSRGANDYGGAIYASTGSVVTVANCAFINNTATFGGAVFLESADLVLSNAYFSGNFAENSGGAICGPSGAIIIVNGSTSWEGNEAVFYGGAILLCFESSLTIFGNATFTNNLADQGGGVWLSESSVVNTLGSVRFGGNTAMEGNYSYGGAVFASTGSVATVATCAFINNNAKFGDAVFLESTDLVLSNAYFSGNLAEHSGGAIYGHFGAIIVVNGSTSWEGNEAMYGGAVRLYSESSLNIASSATFTNNRADLTGRGVWLSANSTMNTLGSVSFDGNTVGGFGGGLYVVDSFAHFLAGSTAHFVNNSAVGGGAILQYGYGEIKIEGHANFAYNTARIGGAMRLVGETVANIVGEVTMVSNTASSSGGAIYCEAAASLHVHNTRFISNSAESSGGAVTTLSMGSKNSEVKIWMCSFEENRAGDAGGAIFTSGGFMDISGSNFTRNTAERSGGAIITSGVVGITRCVLDNNSAYIGPAVSNTRSIFISWTEFDSNALLCNAGYFLSVNTSVSAYDTACHACPREAECQNCTIRNSGEVQVCEPVLAHTTSPLANDTLQTLHVQPGFWRVSYTSEDVRKCYEEEACVGGSEDYCADGYTGPFCAVCADGFVRGLMGYICTECSGERRDTVIAIAVVISVALIAVIVIGIRFLASTSEAERDPPRQMRILESRFKLARACQGLKIVVVSWQIITQFAAVASVTYPEVYDIFLGYIDAVNLDLGWMLSTRCFIKTTFYVDLLMSTIGPLTVTFLVLVSYHVNSRRCRSNDEARIRLRNRHGSVIFWVSFLLYATVSPSIFQCFACDNLDNGKSYLRADHRMECYTREHTYFMVYAGIMSIVYPFGIPFFYGLILYRNRATLRNTASREAAMDISVFKDLWRQYRPEVYFYEVVECLRRVLLSGVVVFIFPNTAGQLAASFIIALFFFTALMVLNPYNDRRDGWLAMTGHLIVIMSMFVALMQKVNTSDDDSLSQNVFAGILIVANCIMIFAVGAEACGMCFLSIKEMNIPVRSPPPNQRILPMSPVMVELPSWNPLQGNEQERQASPDHIPSALERNELIMRNAIL